MDSSRPRTETSLLGKLPAFLQKLIPHSAPEPPLMRLPKIGLALSSGGAKGICHIGVIEVLEENNIPIHAISGSSMGSYIGALYACGVSVDEMKNLAREIGSGKTLSRLADPSNPMQGFIHGRKAKAHLERTIQQQTFEETLKELYIIASDLDTFERVVFRQGVISDAVYASCAIPGIVTPPHIDGRRLTDGGVVDPVPVGPLHKFAQCDHIIAVSTLRRLEDIDHHIEALHLAKKEEELDRRSRSFFKSTMSVINKKFNPAAEGNILDTLRRSIRSAQIRLAYDSCSRADVALHPACRFPCRWHDYSLYETFINYGREAALAALPEIKKLTEPIPHDHSSKASVVGGRVA